MIIDTLDHASAYESIGPRFAQAFEYLRSGRAATDELGTHKLDGDDLFVSVQAYNTKPADQCRWEAHQTYADVQYVVQGCERMGYASLASMTPEQPYDAKNDVAFYTGEGAQLRVPAGTFTVFLPQDAHMPCIADNGKPTPIRKVVVKVRIKG